MFDSCVPILWIRHLATKLHQVNTVSPNPFLNTLLHIVTTVPGIDVEGVHKRGIDRTSMRSMRRLHSTVQTKRHSNHQQIPTQSSLSSLQFYPPRLKYSLQLRKLLECGSCSMSPLCVVPAIQTSEVHRDSVGTRQQLMASVKSTTPTSPAPLWESHSCCVDIWLFVLAETKRRLRHEQTLW